MARLGRSYPIQARIGKAVLGASQNVVMDLVTNTPTVFSPSVSSRRMEMDLVTNTPTVYAPDVIESAYSFTETFTDANGARWPVQWSVFGAGALDLGIDIQSNKGRLTTGSGTYGRLGGRNTAKFLTQNYTIIVDVTVPTFTEWYYYIHLRGSIGVINSYKLASSYQIRYTCTGGVVAPEFYQVDASGAETFRVSMGMSGSPVAGDVIRTKIEVSGSGPVTLKHKSWKVGTAEPGIYTDISANVSTTYTGQYFSISAQGGNNAVSEDFLFDDFSVTALAQTVAMNLVTNTPTVFSPTITNAIGVVLPLVTNTPTVFSPAVLPTQTVTMSARVMNLPTVFAPTVLAQQTVVVPFVVNISTAFNPRVSYTITAVLPLVTNTPTVFSPSAGISTTVTLPLVYMTMSDIILDSNGLPILDSNGLPLRDGTVGVFPPTVQNRVVSVPLVTSPQTVFSPAVATTSQTVVAPLVTSPQTVFSPATRSLVAMSLVTNTPTVFSPTISGGAQTATLPLVTNAATVFAPGAQYTKTAVLPLVTNAFTVFSPAAQPKLYPVLPLVTNAPTVFSPTIIVGYTINMVRVDNPPTVFAPSVNPLLSVITMTLVSNTPTVFAIAVNPGTFLFLPPHDEGGPRKLSEYGRRRQGVSRAANDLVGRYGAPRSFSVLKLNGAYQVIQGPTVRQTLDAEEYYAGGHEYEVDYNTAQALEAAGFDVQGF